MRSRARLACLALLTLVLMPAAAAAQERNVPPRVSIGAGAGLALPLHGDFDFTPWAWDADLRVRLSSRVLFEAAVGQWRHSETNVTQNIRVTMPAGTIGRLQQTTTRVQQTAQANLLVSGPISRVRLTGGGGVGLLQHNRRTRQVTEACSPEVRCGSFESTVSSVSGTAQAVGGIEVRLAGYFALHGQVRFVVPLTDPGSSDLRVTTGIRWRIGA